MRLMLVLGTRPSFIKCTPIIREIERHKEIELQLVHTGQHYDYELSQLFLDELHLPEMTNCMVGSGSHVWQVAQIMLKLEKIILDQKPDIILVPGDTNSTLATALTSRKLDVPLAHEEAGCRSYIENMPEEINRHLTDHCSDLLFAATLNCLACLIKEGISVSKIKLCGDPLFDALMQNLPQADKSDILKRLNLDGDYLLVTVHRAENSNESSLNDVFEALRNLGLPTVFPMHPRLQNMSLVQKWMTRSDMAHVQFIKPLGYHDMLKVVKEAKVVLTDSGGLQREAFWLHVPCISLRKVTEWPETVENGSNYLLGTDKVAIARVVKNIVGKNLKVKGGKDSIGNGKASETIVNTLLENRFSAEV